MKNRILFAYASYGSGHKAVAESIKNYFEKHNDMSKYDLKIMDFSKYSNFFGKAGEKLFQFNFKYRMSFLFDIFYKYTNHEFTTSKYPAIVPKLFNIKKLKHDILEFDPDMLISTHFFPSIVMNYLKKKSYLNPKMITVVTDYISHEMWLKTKKSEDAYIVPSLIVKKSLINAGIAKDKIFDYGLPISDKFSELNFDKNKILKKYHLKDNKLTFLFFGGGSIGTLSSLEYLKKIIKKVDLKSIQIIFIAGHNKQLEEKVRRLCKNINCIKVFGYTNDVANLLYISDGVITKAGAITVTECMEMKKPLLIIKGVGAQENDNMKYLCSCGYAVKTYTPRVLSKTINKAIINKRILDKMKNKLLKNNSNHANKKISKLIIKLLK